MSFWSLLEKYGQQPALVDDQSQTVSYAELADQADQFSMGLGGRRLVFILCDSTIATVVSYLGCLRGRHVALMLDASIEAELLDPLIAIYRPNALIRSDSDGLCPSVEWLNKGDEISLHPDLGLLLSTSGTTGSPKLIRLSCSNLNSNASSISEYLGLCTADRPLAHLPLHYSYGLSVLNSHLSVGATILLSNHAVMQREFWNRIKQEGVSSLAGVPYSYEMMDRLRFERMKLPSLNTMTQAGGRLHNELVEKYARLGREKGFRFFVMYGQTEATARISYLSPELAQDKTDCIGLPVPGGFWWLQSVDGAKISEPGQEGELVYRGENVMLGYAERQADLNLGDQLGGVLKTGDLAVMDGQGMVTITGRIKRTIKVFGNRISLDDLERFFRDKGHLVYCTGEDNLIQLAVLNGALEELVTLALIEKFGFHHSVVRTRVLESIPYLASGKVDYQRLAAQIKD